MVIDPGHGGIHPGAVVASIAEKTVVLAFGLALKEQLEAGGRYRVMMTRDDDIVPLGERVKIARAAGADLFISIHADSLTQAQDVRGATIYTGSERATDADRRGPRPRKTRRMRSRASTRPRMCRTSRGS